MDIELAFFDSHGGLWLSCHADHPEARAFGPLGAAREVAPEEARAAGLPGCAFSYFADTDDGGDDGEWRDGWCRPTSTRARSLRDLQAIGVEPRWDDDGQCS